MSLSNKPTAPSRSANSDAPQDDRVRILIVDDMKTIRAHTRSMLAGGNFIIDEACDGVEAVERAKAILPHLVLMDIVMPEMDGITCCHELKKNPMFESIKVVMVTAKGDYRQIAESFRAGCDDYITKPIDRDKLLAKVEELSKYIHARNMLRPLLKPHAQTAFDKEERNA